MWMAIFIVAAPEAKLIRVWFAEEPEQRELDAAGNELGSWMCVEVRPPHLVN